MQKNGQNKTLILLVERGSEINIEAATICVHSDTPNAPAIAKAVRQTIGNIH